MNLKTYLSSLLLVLFLIASAASQSVERWLSVGPLPVSKPGFVKGKDIKGNEFEDRFILSNPYLNLVDLQPKEEDPLLWDDYIPRTWKLSTANEEGFMLIKPQKQTYQVAYSAFYVESDGLYTFKCKVESPQMFEIFLDGKMVASNYKMAKEDTTTTKSADLKLDRGKFMVLVKSMYKRGENKNKWMVKATVTGKDTTLTTDTSPETAMNIHHLLEGVKLGSLSLSADGDLIAVNYSRMNTESGDRERWTEVKEVASGRIVQSFRKAGATNYQWTPSGKKLTYRLSHEHGSTVMVYDFETGTEYAVLENVKDLGSTEWTDDEKFIFYSISEKETVNNKSSLKYMDELYNRTFRPKSISSLYRYNVNTGVSTRLTFGERSTSLNDVSPDGNFILFSTSTPNPTERPFRLQNMYLMDVGNGKVDTLWKDFRWSGYGSFSPDGKKLMVRGGPDLFAEIGRNIGKNQIANNYDGQIYIYDLESGEIDPITENFDPAMGRAVWHPVDNRIYASVGEEIYGRFYVYDFTGKTWAQIPTVPEVLGSTTIADEALVAAYTGNGLGDPNKAYILDLKTGESRLFDDTEDRTTYRNVTFGEVEEWDFVAKSGTTIRGYFLYPRDFDPEKKYPLIVNYYGGTSPVEKSFGGRYPQDVWAGENYVVYVPQPSGATGFGQEFSARHQNNWGITTIDEIIEGTEKFIEAHDFVDGSKVGCIGASYGGFTTMLLQAYTDIFTCAISHAGISSISSYWGEGYWGFGYSSNATGDSYPWNRKDIYVDQSALFQADKINTPLLLLHGSKDVNVPLGESLQLWVGLKILGKPVELVQVEGEDHHILEYSKRIEWHNTIMAWFDKWLNDDGHDWKKLFPDSKL